MLIVGIDLKEMLPVLPLDSEFTGLPAVADWIQMSPNASAKSSLFIIPLLLRKTRPFTPLSYACLVEASTSVWVGG